MRLLPDGPPSPARTISDTLDEDRPYAKKKMSIDLPPCYMHWRKPKTRDPRRPMRSAVLLVGKVPQTFISVEHFLASWTATATYLAGPGRAPRSIRRPHPVPHRAQPARPCRPRRTRAQRRASAASHDRRDAAVLPDSPASEVPECPASLPSPCILRPPALDALDDVEGDELRHPVPTLQTVPVFVRAGVRRALGARKQPSPHPGSLLRTA